MSLSAKVDVPGTITLPKKALDIADDADDDSMLKIELGSSEVSVSNGRVTISSETATQKLPVNLTDDGQLCAEIEAKTLVDAISKTIFATSERGRFSYDSILITISEGAIRLVATDARILATFVLPQDKAVAHQECRFAILDIDAKKLVRNINKKGGKVEVLLSDHSVIFSVGNGKTVRMSREDIKNGFRFPDWEKVVPKTGPDLTFTFSADNLLRMTKVIDKDAFIRFFFDANGASLESWSDRSQDKVSYHVQGALKTANGYRRVTLGSGYLTKLLSAHQVEELTLSLWFDNLNLVTFTAQDNYQCLLATIEDEYDDND